MCIAKLSLVNTTLANNTLWCIMLTYGRRALRIDCNVTTPFTVILHLNKSFWFGRRTCAMRELLGYAKRWDFWSVKFILKEILKGTIKTVQCWLLFCLYSEISYPPILPTVLDDDATVPTYPTHLNFCTVKSLNSAHELPNCLPRFFKTDFS
jgi:hypothetical protein